MDDDSEIYLVEINYRLVWKSDSDPDRVRDLNNPGQASSDDTKRNKRSSEPILVTAE